MTQPIDLDALQTLSDDARVEAETWAEQAYPGPWKMMQRQCDGIDALIARLRKAEAARIPGDHKPMPADPTVEMIVAIERAIDDQLTASAMNPADMFRQDGESVYRALFAAAPSDSGREG